MNVQERIARLRSRGQTYGFLTGIVATMLVGGLVIPFAFGDRTTTVATTGDGSFGAIGTAPVAGADVASASDESGAAGAVAEGVPIAGGVAAAPTGGDPARPAGSTRGTAAGTAGGATAGSGTSSGGASAPSGSTGGASAAAAEGRIASDQGITAEEIRLGVIVTDLGGTSALGFEPSGYSPKEQQKYFDAHINDLNAKGGINGRIVKPFYETVDILDLDSMRAACQTLADDRKVFAVTHVLGVYGDPILCFTNQKKLPYIAWDGAVFDYYARSNGLLFTTQPSTRRTSLDMARRLSELGELKGKKVGVLRYAEYLDADMTALINYTKQLGVEVVDAEISVSNVGAVPGQLNVAVNRFQSEGVNQVFLMTNTLYAQQFVSQAERQQFLPAYAVSDFDYAAAGNSFLTDMPASFFRRGLLVTSSRIGDTGTTQSTDAACIQVASAFEKRALAPPDKLFYNYLAPCGLVRVIEQGLTRAGLNPTRKSFTDGLRVLDNFENVGFASSSFGPDKTGAPDQVRLVQADRGCKCWKPAGDFTPTGFRGS